MIDDYHRHEALHMASVFSDVVAEHLLEHPAIQADPVYRRLAEEAADKLMELYQEIGCEHFKKEADRAARKALGEPPA